MNITQEIGLIDGLMDNVGYYLTKNGYRNTRRNRLVTALYILRAQPECVARLRDVDWTPIHELLEERTVVGSTTMAMSHALGMAQVYCTLILLNINFSKLVIHASIFILSLSYGLLKLYFFRRQNDYILPLIFILIMIPLFTFLLPLYKAVYLYK